MHIAQMLREVDELESVGDSMYHLARTLSRKRQHEPSPFTNEQKAHMEEMLNLTDKALDNMHSILLDNTSDPVDLQNAYGMENQLNDFRSKCRDENLEAVNTGVYNYRLGTFYNDFIGECERIGDYVINVVQAENEARQPVE